MKIKLPISLIAGLVLTAILAFSLRTNDEYLCIPCGNECDKTQYSGAGTCPVCKMQLVKKVTIHFKNIETDEICQYIASHPKALLLDVRTKMEFEGKANPNFGTLQNAINIPVQELEARMAELNKYKGKEIIIYCSHSHRSPMASYMLTQHGFKNVANMLGGLSVLKDSTCKKQ